jgi:transposase, IS5 family
MRQERTIQATIFEVFAQHEIGCELKAMSQWLDGQRGLISLVAADLRRQGVRQTGRRGLPAESVLRCALLKQQRQLSYEELAFHLEDSASFRAFARLPLKWSPKKSVLHQTIAALGPETWEAVNRALLASAKQDRLESGATVRFDSTVTAALMHEPSDSALLCDAVRVMTRLLGRSETLTEAPVVRWRDRRRLAKKRARAIEYSRGQDKKRQLYHDLVAATQASRAELQAVAAALAESAETAVARWRAEVDHYLPLIARVIIQTQRRVFDGQTVPASEKLVSLFEPHADIIVKGGRAVQYGHKLSLATGKSGLILDVVIEAGNPATPSASYRCSTATLRAPAHRRGRPPPTAATPAAPISTPPRPAVLPTSPSTRSAASPLPTWSKVLGCTAGCATSAPASRPASPASSAPMALHVARGAGSTISRPTSGPPWWLTTWSCSPASNRCSYPSAPKGGPNQQNHTDWDCSQCESRVRCYYQNGKRTRNTGSATAPPSASHFLYP